MTVLFGSNMILLCLIGICDAPDGPDPGAHAAPVSVSPVFSGPQRVLVAPVVGVLIEQPVAMTLHG